MSTPPDELSAIDPSFGQSGASPNGQLITQMQGDLDTDTQSLGDLSKENKPEPFTQAEPQRNSSVLSLAPFLIGLTALGGKAAGLHARVMLGATNGMMQGMLKGNEQKYQDEKKKYDDAYQRWYDKFTMQQKLYAEMRQVYKGRIDADIKALDFARKATGDQEKTSMDSFKKWLQSQQLGQRFQAENDKVDHNKALEDIARQKVDAAKQKQAQKQNEHTKGVTDSISQIDNLIAQLNANPDVAGARGLLQRGMETAHTATGMGSQNVHAHTFQSGMEALMLQVPKLLTGSSRSAKDERARVDDIANALKVGSTAPIAIGKLNELKQILQGKLTQATNEPDEHGFIVGQDYKNKGKTATYLGDGQWQLKTPSTP